MTELKRSTIKVRLTPEQKIKMKIHVANNEITISKLIRDFIDGL